MPEILQIFHQPPPSQYEMHPHLQRGLVNVESQLTWSIEPHLPSSEICDVADHFQSSEFTESPFTNFSSSSVDELSKVTAIIEQDQNLKKRKLEEGSNRNSTIAGNYENQEVDSRKQRAEGDSAKSNKRHGNSKPKPDYIHVRARSGQATDSHSLAERARREKIKKKMQFLQDLVPGCSRITNKAAILDEIITYVQCLQSEVEFLNMKLAASTTSVDFEYGQLIA